ncbi:hypothetical protein D3C86_1829080 [compost metagenome]
MQRNTTQTVNTTVSSTCSASTVSTKTITPLSIHSCRPISAMVRNSPRQISEISARPWRMPCQWWVSPDVPTSQRPSRLRISMPAIRQPTNIGSCRPRA